MGPIGDVLARRPDVQEAERRLAASTARIGVAKADFYPHVSLSGFLGFLSSHGTDFMTAGSQAWSIMPGITWDGLNVRRVRANLHAAQARSDAAQATYEQSILIAIEDVDSAVTSYNETHARVGKLVDQFAQSHHAADLARVRYREGSTGFLELLDAERVELAAGDDLAQAESDINVRAVALYKSLGGGWEACGGERCDGLAQTTFADDLRWDEMPRRYDRHDLTCVEVLAGIAENIIKFSEYKKLGVEPDITGSPRNDATLN
jgi:multidrug efflux system outer membrane protein